MAFAGYDVFVNYIMRTSGLTAGLRQVQANVRSVQGQMNVMNAAQVQHARTIRRYMTQFGSIYGSPKDYAEARKNLRDIGQRRLNLQDAIIARSALGNNADLKAQDKALARVQKRLTLTAQDLKMKEDGVAADARAATASRVAQARTDYRLAQLAQAENRERRAAVGHMAGAAAGVARNSAIGAGLLGWGVFDIWKAAGEQQQAAMTTAMVMHATRGAKGPSIPALTDMLFKSELATSMGVGMLSSMDIANIQRQIAMHIPGLTTGQMATLTPLVAKYADVMKMTNVPGAQDPEESAKVAVMAVNQLGLKPGGDALRKYLERFFVMEQSTGVSQDVAINALAQFSSMGHAMGFSPQAILDLYGQVYRLGAGGGRVGARLGSMLSEFASLPTTVKKAWGMPLVGATDAHGNPILYQQAYGHRDFDAILKVLNENMKRMPEKKFWTGIQAAFGLGGMKVLMPLIQAGSIEQYEKQRAREVNFASIEDAQKMFFNLPINQWKRFFTNLQTLIIAFGSTQLNGGKITKFFHDMADIFQKGVEWIERNKAAAGAMFDGLTNLFLALAGVAALSTVTSGILNIVKFAMLFGADGALEGVGAALVAFLTGPIGIVTMLAAAAGLLILFRKQWEQALGRAVRVIVDGWKPFWDKVWAGISGALTTWGQAQARNPVNLLGPPGMIGEAIVNGIKEAAKNIKQGYDEAGNPVDPKRPKVQHLKPHHHAAHHQPQRVTLVMDHRKVGEIVTKVQNRGMRAGINHSTGTQDHTNVSVLETILGLGNATSVL